MRLIGLRAGQFVPEWGAEWVMLWINVRIVAVPGKAPFDEKLRIVATTAFRNSGRSNWMGSAPDETKLDGQKTQLGFAPFERKSIDIPCAG